MVPRLDRGTLRLVYNVTRRYLCHWLILQQQQLLGGEGYAVVIDETWVAKQKTSKSIRGRATRPQSVLVLGGVELDLATRKQTGRVFLRPICNRRAETLKRVIQSYVVPGTAVWTDDFASYCFLTDLGYRHTSVNHSAGEVVTADKQGTNAVAGLFARCKRFLRQLETKWPSKGKYGLLLAEFVWRTAALGNHTIPQWRWPRVVFWRLLSCLAAVEKHRQREDCGDLWQSSMDETFEAQIPTDIAPSGFDTPLTQEQVCTTEYFQSQRPLTLQELQQAQEAAMMLFGQEVDEVLDLGPKPKGRPGRKPGGGRGGLRGRKQRGRPLKKKFKDLSCGQVATIDLDHSGSDAEPISEQSVAMEPLQNMESLESLFPDPFAPRGAHECPKCGEVHAMDLCPWYPLDRCEHADAGHEGVPAPQLHDLQIQKLGKAFWQVNDTKLKEGKASGEGCNCLIDSLLQLLDSKSSKRSRRLKCAAVRAALQEKIPGQVQESNYLSLADVWKDVLQELKQHPNDFSIVYLSKQYPGNGNKVGDGQRLLYVLNLSNVHFVPLWPQ